MQFTPTQLQGAYIIAVDPIRDERGFFARASCAREFERIGIDPRTGHLDVRRGDHAYWCLTNRLAYCVDSPMMAADRRLPIS